jgi:hypothetical protein
MPMRIIRAAATALLAGVLAAAPGSAQESRQAQGGLRPPSAFAGTADRAERSRTLFMEAAKVFTSPRCLNCHPAGDHPLQGDDHHAHEPPVKRGVAGAGIPGLPCASCHTSRNVDLFPGAAASFRSIPGHPRWELAPLEMAWEGKSTGEICRQLKDKDRNGGRDLSEIAAHVGTDDLVAYGWAPGSGRAPAPGTQALAGELVTAWIDTGAECP